MNKLVIGESEMCNRLSEKFASSFVATGVLDLFLLFCKINTKLIICVKFLFNKRMLYSLKSCDKFKYLNRRQQKIFFSNFSFPGLWFQCT